MKQNIKHIGLQFFGMTNLDTIRADRMAIMQRMADATRENDTDGFANAFGDLADNIRESIMEDVRSMQASQDNTILAARGYRVLTSTETRYYQTLMNAMKSDNPKQALTGVDTVLPKTVIDAVFEDIKTSHPLISAINFRNTEAMVEILLSTTDGAAAWGELDQKIEAELSASFVKLDLTLASLVAFILVPRSMLELGPQWMDRYVREVLVEAIAVQLEVGIVAGDGDKKPIGMMKKLTGAVDGVYPDKIPLSVNDLSAATMGGILRTLSMTPAGKSRSVASIIMVVNPADYFTKVFPATTPRALDGTYNHDVMPYPTTIIQSAAVPAGKAVFGIGKKYFMGLGTQSGGKIEHSDEYKFLERKRAYSIYLYGYGRALDENAFVYADISGMKDYALPVTLTDAEETRLSKLSIGALELFPGFDKNVTNYAATTSNATNTISAVAKDGDAIISIKNGETTVNNGAAANWSDGENVVSVTVTNGGSGRTYTVVVTKE